MHTQRNMFQGKFWWKEFDICCKLDMAGSVLGLCTFVDRLIADFGIVLSTLENAMVTIYPYYNYELHLSCSRACAIVTIYYGMHLHAFAQGVENSGQGGKFP